MKSGREGRTKMPSLFYIASLMFIASPYPVFWLLHFLIATIMSGMMADITDSSPLSIVVLSPEFVVGLVHEHAILKEHDVQDPPEAEQEWQHEEELPVSPGEDCDADCDQEEVEECSLRRCVPHIV